MSKIRVLITDDHALIRRGIASLLNDQADMEVVAEAGSGEEALQQMQKATPDVVLMDISMPGMDGLEVAKRVQTQFPGVRLLILTMHDREDYLFRAVRAGAAGYILKGADVQDLLSAIRTVHKGDVYLSPKVTSLLLTDYLRRAETGEQEASYDGLTEREREVLRMIAQGQTTGEIAEALHLSRHTVDTHRDHIMQKLNLHRKAELIKYAIRKGLVASDE